MNILDIELFTVEKDGSLTCGLLALGVKRGEYPAEFQVAGFTYFFEGFDYAEGQVSGFKYSTRGGRKAILLND